MGVAAMATQHGPRPHSGRAGLAAVALVAAVLTLGLPLLSYRSVTSLTQGQQQVLRELREALQAAKGERDSAKQELADAHKQLEELRRTLETATKSVSSMNEWTEEIKFDLAKHRRQFSPADKISEQPAGAIVRIDSKGQFVASPSLVKLPNGRLLAALERSVSWGVTQETTMKLIYSSNDGGASWQRTALVGPMNWPQLFSCASGVYLLGTERHFSSDNNLVISKMLDEEGKQWSTPTRITHGLSVVSANTGVDVSRGRVTKSFEVIPSMAKPIVTTTLTKDVQVGIQGGVGGPTWQQSPMFELSVASTRGFVQYTLVKVPYEGKAVFFRIDEIQGDNSIRARLERFNLFWQTSSITLPTNSSLQVASGSQVYGGVDWVATAISADETADLRTPEAWVMADGVGNPASMYSHEMRSLFDVAFRGDADVRKSIIGFDVEGLNTSAAWDAGFGSLYWMEGVATRLVDRHGGNGKLLSIMRVNNDMLCDLAAVVEFDDSTLLPAAPQPEGQKEQTGAAQKGQLRARFLRYTFVPGLGVGHPAILYDEVSDLYWMVSNINRDSTRNWKQPDAPDQHNPQLHITLFSKCEVDRSTLGLFYSPNLMSWVLAGMVDYHISLGRHFAYPHMLIDGRDLLIVSRAAFAPWARSADAPLNEFYNNHNSNTIAFHRVRNFRHYANQEWAAYQGPYSSSSRRTAMKDEVEMEDTRFSEWLKQRQAAEDAAAAADAAARAAAQQQQQQQQQEGQQQAQQQGQQPAEQQGQQQQGQQPAEQQGQQQQQLAEQQPNDGKQGEEPKQQQAPTGQEAEQQKAAGAAEQKPEQQKQEGKPEQQESKSEQEAKQQEPEQQAQEAKQEPQAQEAKQEPQAQEAKQEQQPQEAKQQPQDAKQEQQAQEAKQEPEEKQHQAQEGAKSEGKP